jgi:hypothetical protein
MIPTPNDGSRPSRLQLDRYATGELTGGDRAELEDRLDDAGRAHLAALDQARAALPPLDLASVRARARALGPTEAIGAPTPVAANDTRAFRWLGAVLALAAAVLVAIGIGQQGGPDAPIGDHGFRSGEAIVVYEQDGAKLEPWSGEPLGQGDTLGFEVTRAGAGVVLLSVDGTGAVSVFWPAQGDEPEPLAGDGLVPLSGTIVLDGAPGTVVFVTVYDRSVPEARALVEQVLRERGAAGLVRWAQETSGVGAVEVPRR